MCFWLVDIAMINQKNRAELAAITRADKMLSSSTSRVMNALLYGCMDVSTGRIQAFRERIAALAGVSVRTVTRATKQLQERGYLLVVHTYQQCKRSMFGRWFCPKGANVFVINPKFGLLLRDKSSPIPSLSIDNKNRAASKVIHNPMPESLVQVLARFGHAIADRAGLPGSPNEYPQPVPVTA